jgi:carbamoyl-phosphate synthase/aspartate carbamoyltransferase
MVGSVKLNDLAIVEDIDEELVNPTDKRIFAIASAFHQGYSVDEIWQTTNIDKWFLSKLQHIHHMKKQSTCVNSA